MVDQYPKESSSPRLNSGFFDTKKGRRCEYCCKHFGAGILGSCNCPPRSGQDVPANLQRDTCYSLFCALLSLYERKLVTPLMIRALRMGYSVYFRLQATFLSYKKDTKAVECKGGRKKKTDSNVKPDLLFPCDTGRQASCKQLTTDKDGGCSGSAVHRRALQENGRVVLIPELCTLCSLSGKLLLFSLQLRLCRNFSGGPVAKTLCSQCLREPEFDTWSEHQQGQTRLKQLSSSSSNRTLDPACMLTESVTLWTVACQAPLSRGFSRREYWRGLPWLSVDWDWSK